MAVCGGYGGTTVRVTSTSHSRALQGELWHRTHRGIVGGLAVASLERRVNGEPSESHIWSQMPACVVLNPIRSDLTELPRHIHLAHVCLHVL